MSSRELARLYSDKSKCESKLSVTTNVFPEQGFGW